MSYDSMLASIDSRCAILTSNRFPFLKGFPKEELNRIEARLLRFDSVKPETLPRGRFYTGLYHGLSWGSADSLDEDVSRTWTPAIRVTLEGDSRVYKALSWPECVRFAQALDSIHGVPTWGTIAQAADKAFDYPHSKARVIGAYQDARDIEELTRALDRTLRNMDKARQSAQKALRRGRRALCLDSTGLEACELSRLVVPPRDGASKAIDLARRAHRASRYGCQQRAIHLAMRADEAMSLIK